MAATTFARDLARRADRTWLRYAIVVPLAGALVAGNLAYAGRRIDAATDADDAGRIEWGPTHPAAVEMFDQVEARTDPDAIVGAPKARAMTWATERRSVQVGGSWRVPTSIELDAIVVAVDDDLRAELVESGEWTETWVGRRFAIFEP